jgi:thioredoxin-related protein
MKIFGILLIFLLILFLWLIAHALYKPIFNKVSKDFVIDEESIKIANICILIMLCLSLTIGLII